tara:strand:- start:21 stop:443 length:423 start_codon:yes stop_codon:yes gene_type:complete
MFDREYYTRLKIWRDFRNSIEKSETPFEDVLEFWRTTPLGRLAADPYDSKTWPDPWELIANNDYCEFLQILGICYTLQLTERFSNSAFEIHIVLDEKESNIIYLLFVDNQAIGYYNNGVIDRKEIKHLKCQMHHTVNLLN